MLPCIRLENHRIHLTSMLFGISTRDMGNLGQKKLKKWRGDRGLREAARILGVDYRSYYRWEVEGVVPGYTGRDKCLERAGIPYKDWDRR